MGKYSDKLNERVRVKGRLHGFCQICGFERKLSRDHVPPKKCNNLTDHDLSVLPLPSQYKIKSQPSQGGTHFKTICEECNNGTLGTEYDPELIKLTNEITSTVSAIGQRIIPIRRVIYLNIKPQRIARSIIGHLLAAIYTGEVETGLIRSPMFDTLRYYFLNKDIPLPRGLNIYYWIYPSRRQVIIKNCGKMTLYSSEPVLGGIIKFLPIGFWIVWEKPKDFVVYLNELLPHREVGIDDIVQIPIDLYNIPNLFFSEQPEDNEILVMSDTMTCVASPRIE